jgi:transcription termination/antitermination protein NusA
MNTLDLRHLIAQVAKEKGITQEKLHEALENAMLKAAKKVFGTNKAIEANFDENRGEISLFHVIKIVTDEDELEPEEDMEAVEETEGISYLLRREEKDKEMRRLTKFYEENQLHVDVARNEYALDLNVGQYIRLPILYHAELLTGQLSNAKDRKRRSKKGPQRDELNAHIQALETRLYEENLQTQKYTERFGDLLLLDSRHKGFGRIAAQAAKLVIQEKVRQAERDKIFEDFSGREEIETGEIRRFDRNGDIIVALTTPDQEQQVEALLPRREQIPHENYRLGKHIRCIIKSVSKEAKGKEAKGTQIVLSQRHENFIKKLFEQNVPEIYHGIVEIRDVARLYGEARGVKVSVYSKDPSVDPAGACIGPNGARVKLVEAEIGHDKIEIVPFSAEPYIYVCNALQPAEVSRLLIDHEYKKMDVIVPDDQLSKAIGKRGKNVRLASELTGWNLDIYAESKMIEQENRIRETLAVQESINPEALDAVWQMKSVRSLEQIAEFETEDISDLPGVSQEDADNLITVAKDLLKRRDEGEEIYQSAQAIIDEAWTKWPKDDEILNRDFFARCVNLGLYSLERLVNVSPQQLAKLFDIDEENAMYLIDIAQSYLD